MAIWVEMAYMLQKENLGTSLNVKIYVYNLDKSFTFDVCNDTKTINGKSRISSQMLKIIKSHRGEKIDVFVSEATEKFDPRVLLS